MSLIYVFASSPMEGQPVRKIADSPVSPGSSTQPFRCGPNEVVLVIGGMGPRGARAKAEEMLGLTSSAPEFRKPDAVLVTGLCGGLTPSLPEGRIVVYLQCLSTEIAKPALRCSQLITDSVVALLTPRDIRCDSVVGITSPRIATTRDERLVLARSGASAVDMESYSILDSAATAGVPAGVLRVVSDSIERDLPDFNRALNDAGALDGRKALTVALGSPIRTAKLLAANKRAMQHLAKALEVVLRSDYFARTTSRESD